MRDLINIIELIVIARVLWKTLRFLRGKKKHKTLLGKVWLLISRQLHGSLDSKLIEQNKKLSGASRKANEKVVQFSQYKRKHS